MMIERNPTREIIIPYGIYIFLIVLLMVVQLGKSASMEIGGGSGHIPGVLSLSQPIQYTSEESENFSPEFNGNLNENEQILLDYNNNYPEELEGIPSTFIDLNVSYCPKTLDGFVPDFDASQVFQTLGFHDSWIRNKWFWGAKDFDFEGRYISRFKGRGADPNFKVPEITVFVVPHSHSDPGWLKTFEGYFHANTKYTLDYAVEKLTLYPNMTFIWNEISFLSKWWDHAKTDQKIKFIQLIREGRLEILTGGWVMQDEATVNLYSMIDQLIEGRQWVKSKLGIVPKISWSIDPFGHGSTFPYILKTAHINHMVIQRLHYAWKKYFGETQYGNFDWVQRWDNEKAHSIMCHNAPYDLYTTKHTCGPDPYVCLKFDFRNIYGEYSEYMRHARPVTNSNIRELSEAIVEQFRKTASLQPHNIVMFPLGDDFRFDKEQEWDQQYENYTPLMNYINSNWNHFKTNIRFGTVSDYFKAVEKQNIPLPSFTGDFFPYSDIYVSGRPAYWTGYYGTRPYWKKFYRETESYLRSAEILFTYATNLARQKGDSVANVVLTREHRNLIDARRHLALFAHHDGATGTSKRITMDDYGRKLLDATKTALHIQRVALRSIMLNAVNVSIPNLGLDFQQQHFGDAPAKIARVIYETPTVVKKLVLFNSLGWFRIHLAKVLVTSPFVSVYGPLGTPILSQINPVVEFTEEGMMKFRTVYELTFLAELDALAVTTFEIRKSHPNDPNTASKPFVTCKICSDENSFFEVETIKDPLIVLGNGNVELLFDAATGFLQRITKLQEDLSAEVQLSFGAYQSIFRESGAYLLHPDTESKIQIPFEDSELKLLVVEGPILSYISLYQAPMKVTTRLFKTPHPHYSDAIYQENIIDLGNTPAEVYMRFQTSLNSTTTSAFGQSEPTVYTDQNGFTMERRVRVPWIKYEGNNYPVNTMAYIQDAQTRTRFSILVDRAHGFSSMFNGRLETLIERRTQFDDGRGMSEGVTDNRRTISNYILLLEQLQPGRIDPTDPQDLSNNLSTLRAHHSSLGLSYPSSIFIYDDSSGGYLGIYSLLSEKLPSDSHLINLRTLSNTTLPLEEDVPSNNALLIVQKLGYLPEVNDTRRDCSQRNNNNNETLKYPLFREGTLFNSLRLEGAQLTDLAGVSSHSREIARGGPLGVPLPYVAKGPFEITSILLEFSSNRVNNRSYQFMRN